MLTNKCGGTIVAHMILGYSKEHILERLNRYIKKSNTNDCHYWVGSLTRKGGYGNIKIREKGNRDNIKIFKAHRLIYEFLVGPIGDKHVLHKCDNPQCVNPKHLFLGTHQDNMRDMVQKRRTAYGVKSKSAKLTPHDVIEIRKLYARGGHTTRSLGAKYGVDGKHIHNIITGKKWKIVT
jgi:hypothetical protein